MTFLEYPQINAGSYTGQGGVGYTNGDDSYNTQASTSKVWGSHSVKVGGELRQFRDTAVNPGSWSGNFTFGRNWTQANPLRADSNSGNEIADLLLGYPQVASSRMPSSLPIKVGITSLFFKTTGR
ncbi:MAG: hypothetical protein JWO80_389 [Bryobacterales bacterium]|nr:hypothetical protein [Bryobacterales bacterium]